MYNLNMYNTVPYNASRRSPGFPAEIFHVLPELESVIAGEDDMLTLSEADFIIREA